MYDHVIRTPEQAATEVAAMTDGDDGPADYSTTPELDLLHHAWTLLANVGGSDWTTQSEAWQRGALAWRARFHRLLEAQ